MKNKIIYILTASLLLYSICACSSGRQMHNTISHEGTFSGISAQEQFDRTDKVYLDESAPIISFTAATHSPDGTPEYYLFDDNPEHLNDRFLADGITPSSIAHFENLTPGIYTVFSYHHRGYSVDLNEDLYYDAAFSTPNSGEIKILNIGLDHDWDWNQAWADYSNSVVLMPEYLNTYDCNCGSDCECITENGSCKKAYCPAIVRNEKRTPNTADFDHLNTAISINSGTPALLSDLITHISQTGLNQFRYGSYQEPMWLMMRFRVISGTVTFDTIAYQSKDAALKNFPILANGPFDNEAQYKGIAYNSPVVTAEFNYNINDSTAAGPIPVTVKNSRVPNGCTIKNGTFATNINTWKETYPIAAESDIMLLNYEDDSKLNLYGDKVKNRNNIWHFDPFHTKNYDDGKNENIRRILSGYNIKTDDFFEPNTDISNIIHPSGNEISTDDFYKYTACNLGNFGVTNKYIVHVTNSGKNNRSFKFDMKSIAGQVYKYKQTDSRGRTVTDDGGNYYMKKFDNNPAEDPASESNPKQRLAAAEYSDTLCFNIAAQSSYTIQIEITTLTGCTAPMHNTMLIE